MAERIYLDHNATTPLRPAARAAVLEALDRGGNPSAVTAEGRAARACVENARAQVAQLVGAEPEDVIFTSGGSEGAATLLTPAFGGGSASLVVSAVEHSCVLSGGRFSPADRHVCPVDGTGRVDLAALEALLVRLPRPALVAVMAANNETGVLQPLAEVGRLVARAGGRLVVDAVQALGKIDVSLAAWGADAAFVSGHKIGAPPGIGAIVLRPGGRGFERLIAGGGQEAHRRAGTENVPGIAGLGAAAAELRRVGGTEMARLAALRETLETGLRGLGASVTIVGDTVPRLSNTILFADETVSGETALIACDLAGVSVATGSACASGRVAASHVLAAMGLPDTIRRSAVRVSLGWTSTEAEIEAFLGVWKRHRDRVTTRTVRAA